MLFLDFKISLGIGLKREKIKTKHGGLRKDQKQTFEKILTNMMFLLCAKYVKRNLQSLTE